MLDFLGSVSLSNSDKAGVIGLAVVIVVFVLGYLFGRQAGAREQRESTQRPVPMLFHPSNQPDRYYQ